MKKQLLVLLFTNILFLAACSSSSDNSTPVTPAEDEPNTNNALDSDADGLTDSLEVQLGLDPLSADSDSDGIADGIDQFPAGEACEVDSDANTDNEPMNDADTLDTDGDGISDSEDRFPNDPTESVDANGDGLGDNANPIVAVIDTDADGLTDEQELELGTDPRSPDTDADGFTDLDDRFPNDPLANADSDNDGVDDARDAFPNDPTETTDLNGDGLGDNANPIDGTVITGTVSDMVTGAAIASAQVSLDLINSDSQNNALVLASTDASGSFSMVAPNNLLPDSFVLVVTREGYRPEVAIFNNNNDTSVSANIEMVPVSSDFTLIEANPTVHHLGDDTFGGSENSQFQRTSEGVSLVRNFNVTADQADSTEIFLRWVAKGIQFDNRILINGQLLSVTPTTNTDGSFNEQSIALAVGGILVEGSNTIEIQSEDGNTFDDFEFVFIGLTGLN